MKSAEQIARDTVVDAPESYRGTTVSTSLDYLFEAIAQAIQDERDRAQGLVEALRKVENTALIGHKEPDDKTRLYCLSNIATEALKKYSEE